ncbi:MAG TPA: tetratricopeptide repeat-containing sensor histidine kinase [Patescibacteria group bacterium]|nr:tetratricopeptide repeat-containing sensor histidine kinase [Patescibacteria group bacterium]
MITSILEILESAKAQSQTQPHIALQKAQKALSSALSIHNDRLIAESKTCIALCQRHLGEKEAASANFLDAIADFERLGLYDMQAATLREIGVLHYYTDEPQIALQYFEKSLALREQHCPDDTKAFRQLYNSLGTAYSSVGNTILSVEYYLKSLAIAEELSDHEGAGATLNNLGHIYQGLYDRKTALEYYHKSLEKRRTCSDILGEARTLINIGGLLIEELEFEEALRHLAEAEIIIGGINAPGLEMILYAHLGLAYATTGSFTKSLSSLEKAFVMAEASGSPGAKVNVLMNFAQVYKINSDFPVAINYLLKALPIAEENSLPSVVTILDFLAQCYEQSGEFALALLYFKRFHNLSQDQKHAEKEKEIARLQIEFDIERAEKENEIYRLKNIELANAIRERDQLNAHLQANNEKLQRISDEKSEMLGIATHDLKNPLSVIGIVAKALKNNAHSITPDLITEYATDIEQTANEMFALVKNFLDINAIESGAISLKQEPVNISIIAENLVTSYSERARHKLIEIVLLAEDECFAVADPTAIVQIMDNLISNAIKYSPFEKSVFVSVNSGLDLVTFTVRDEGPGIPEQDRIRLFKKFARLSTEPTGGEHSSGLGLSIVKKLVESMNGCVYYRDNATGGACFVVELPAFTSAEIKQGAVERTFAF